MECLAWQAIINCSRYNCAPGNAVAMSELDKSTLFSGVRTADTFKSGASLGDSYAQMKESHQCWCLQAFISIVIYPAIRSYDEQAFDNMSEESEKKKVYRKEIVAAYSKSKHG